MSIYSWGLGTLGQLGTGQLTSSTSPVRMKLPIGEKPVSVKTGALYTLVLTQKGDMYVCGCGKHGRLGTGTEENESRPVNIEVNKHAKVSQITCGVWHCCAITYMGKLFSWGYNAKYHVLGRLSNSLNPAPMKQLSDRRVVSVACGHHFTIVLTDEGKLFSWGFGKHGVLGHGNEQNIDTPAQVDSVSPVFFRSIEAGSVHCAATSVEGRVFLWGKGEDGQLGFGGQDLAMFTEPTWNSHVMHEDIVQASCSRDQHFGFTLLRTSKGDVYSCGSNMKGKLGIGSSAQMKSLPVKIDRQYFDNSPVKSISAGALHAAAVNAKGDVFTWGCGKDGKLGHGNEMNSYSSNVPRIVPDLPNDLLAVSVSTSAHHTVVIME